MSNPEQFLIAITEMTLDELSDDEIVILHNFLTFPDSNIKNCCFYDKISNLFTEKDGAEMHQITYNAVTQLIQEGLEKI